MDIKNIVFDLGGVLIDWDPKLVYRKIFDTEKEVQDFLSKICVYEWNIMQDAGRPLSEATETLVANHPEWADEIRAYYGRWEEMLAGPISGTVELLEKFTRDDRYKVYALTNWSAETFPIAQTQYDFLSWFDGIVVSGVEKCIKPNPKIYKILFDRYNLVPSESIFIDDNKDNVEASKALGMDALHFKSSEDLEAELEMRKLL